MESVVKERIKKLMAEGHSHDEAVEVLESMGINVHLYTNIKPPRLRPRKSTDEKLVEAEEILDKFISKVTDARDLKRESGHSFGRHTLIIQEATRMKKRLR